MTASGANFELDPVQKALDKSNRPRILSSEKTGSHLSVLSADGGGAITCREDPAVSKRLLLRAATSRSQGKTAKVNRHRKGGVGQELMSVSGWNFLRRPGPYSPLLDRFASWPWRWTSAISRLGRRRENLTLTVPSSSGAVSEQLYCSFLSKASANVIFFPGDVQDFEATMRRNGHGRWTSYGLEATMSVLEGKFPTANVLIVRPSKLIDKSFACFSSFIARTDSTGAAVEYDCHGRAAEHVLELLDEVEQHGRGSPRGSLSGSAESSRRLSQSGGLAALPVVLVGFSKGGIVLNQLVTELGAEGASTPASRLFSNVSAAHWIDSGNGSQRGSLPTQPQVLTRLAQFHDIKLHVHVTPYQLRAPRRPWIQRELETFTQTLTELGLQASLAVHRYHEQEEASLKNHFRVLKEFHC